MRFAVVDDALDAASFADARAFVDAYVALADGGYDAATSREAWLDDDAVGGDDDGDDDGESGTTTLTSAFWTPRDALAAPRCAIEALAGACARALGLASDETLAGAEWWVQDVAWDEPPKGYHTDCDVKMRDGVGARGFPAMASVFYVDGERGGGATAAFDQTTASDAGRETATGLWPETPERVFACEVRKNRLMAFEGDRWHGVLANEGGFRGQRVTVLVNWWRERPSGARNLPNRFVSPTRTARLGKCVPVEPRVVKRASYEDDRAAWEAQEMPPVAGESVVPSSVVEFDYSRRE